MAKPKSPIKELAEQLARDFPKFRFAYSDDFRWSPTEMTIYFDPSAKTAAELLHELGHALLNHENFNQDIELIHMERDAWEQARSLATQYGVKIRENTVEDAMDEYREWLHARSLCPKCVQTGIQSRLDGVYSCLNCGARWTANDARRCGLRRKVAKS